MSLAAGDMGTRISPADRILFCRAVASGDKTYARIESKWWGEQICPVRCKGSCRSTLKFGARMVTAVASQLEGITMRSVFLFHIVAVACLMWGQPLPLVGQQVDFEREVVPLLEDRCCYCHGEEDQESNLRLDHRLGMLKGGDSGLPRLFQGSRKKATSSKWFAISILVWKCRWMTNL